MGSMKSRRSVLAAVAVVAFAVVGCVATVPPGPGGGGEKALVCHQGTTLAVAVRALDAHLAHGDTRGPCL